MKTGYAPVNGLQLYYEIHGEGDPLVLLHGGLGSGGMFGDCLLPALAAGRQVITADLQAHGRTADIDRALTSEAMGDDIAALLSHLAIDKADLCGYSLGGGAALRAAIQHPQLVRKLVLLSVPYCRTAWYPDVLNAMAHMSAALAPNFMQSPMYLSHASIAPRPEDFPVLLDKIGALLRTDYDWSAEVAALTVPTLVIFADADSIFPAHMASFYGLLGGGKADAGWNGENMPQSRLAILPGQTHYDLFKAPLAAPAILQFLDAR